MSKEQTRFRKARRSAWEDECVEIGRTGDLIKIRDSKAREAGALSFSVAAVQGLFDSIRRQPR
ncbi:DUF397 domain-containing protein [Actinomadura soli]|nr:DUF397 domain-containing protein [Actinomadura soli]